MRALVVVLVLCSAVIVVGQHRTAPELEVASIKRNTSETRTPALPASPYRGQFVMSSATPCVMLSMPIAIRRPRWIKEARFDLQGRMRSATTHAEVQAMFRNLLADRFTLRTHIDKRFLDVYLLTLKTPGALGPGLTRADTACVVWRIPRDGFLPSATCIAVGEGKEPSRSL